MHQTLVFKLRITFINKQTTTDGYETRNGNIGSAPLPNFIPPEFLKIPAGITGQGKDLPYILIGGPCLHWQLIIHGTT